MRTRLSAQIDNLTTVIFLLVAGLIPLFVATFTTEFYETPKLIFMFVAVSLLLILKAVQWVLAGKVSLTRTPIDVPLMIFLVVVLISAILSPEHYISFIGNLPRLHGSASSWVIYVVFYFLATSHFKSIGQVRNLLYAVLISGVVLSIVTFMSYFGAYLPFPFAKAANFSPAGGSFSTNAILVMLLPLLLVSINGVKKFVPANVAILISTLFAVVLALTGNLAVVVGAALGFLLVVLFSGKGDKFAMNAGNISLFVPLI